MEQGGVFLEDVFFTEKCGSQKKEGPINWGGVRNNRGKILRGGHKKKELGGKIKEEEGHMKRRGI